MDNEIAKDAIMDAIENRRIARQAHDKGLDEALKIVSTPIIEYPDVQRLIVAIEEAKVKRGQYREILEALLVPTNFIGIETAREYICEALESYGLAELSKP